MTGAPFVSGFLVHLLAGLPVVPCEYYKFFICFNRMPKKFVWTSATVEATVRITNLAVNIDAVKLEAQRTAQDWRVLFEDQVRAVVRDIFEMARKENASKGGKALWAKIKAKSN